MADAAGLIMAREPLGTKLSRLQMQKQSRYGLLIRPSLTRMPLPIQRCDDPFLPFSKAIITAARDLACAFVFDLGAYLSLGAAGAVALERSIAFAAVDAATILHGPFKDDSFVEAAGDLGFNVDEVTVYDASLEAQYRRRVNRAVFLVDADDHEQAVLVPEMGCIHRKEHWTGTYLTASGEALSLKIMGDDIVYASVGENFAEAARDVLLKVVAGGS
jgi:hypothetical protein